MGNFVEERVAARRFLGIGLAAIVLAPAAAISDVEISSQPTKHMRCSAGVCVPTKSNAVLNVSDLANMLASGDLTIATAGSSYNIEVKAPVSWSAANTLSLKATVGIAIDAPVSSAGGGGLSLQYPSLTYLTFGQRGRVSFQNLASALTIGGTAYTLANSISSLASAIASNPSGSYALADNYDASADGTYSASPIQTTFTGSFEGLGNTISHLSIRHSSDSPTLLGLFSLVVEGVVQHLRLSRERIESMMTGQGDVVGGLAGEATGAYFLEDSNSEGALILKSATSGTVGGLVGSLVSSQLDICFVSGKIDASKTNRAAAGGLVAGNASEITESFSTASVTVGRHGLAGGLVGSSRDLIENSYTTGSVSGDKKSTVGGLTGNNPSKGVEYVYSTGAVSGEPPSFVGGFAGENSPRLSNSYWNTTTSGTTQAVGKGNSRGITGLTTQQLQSGLPAGFDPKIWAENPNINNGFPYLVHNPPPK